MKLAIFCLALYCLGCGPRAQLSQTPATPEAPPDPRRFQTLDECERNLKNLATGCEMFASDHGGRYPKNLSELPMTIPRCQETDYQFESTAAPDRFTLSCTASHAATVAPAGYPRYSSDLGLQKAPAGGQTP